MQTNKAIVAATGEPHRVRDQGLLDSAAFAPRNMHLYGNEHDVVRLAVRLMRSVGKNHPFEQGNKRTAFNASVAFMRMNGLRVILPDTESLARQIEAFIAGDGDEAEMVLALAACVSASAI
ncbi:Fic family protein [Mesorhizobium sp. RP14(2022)]|uniref:Fic family protein n=1 Tax=Mesorhizobium liriopis TaxID=2953882 RepID=A0ABT1C7M6_9HYPH|nr:Fic family protein [Mesorhizobium liriopis]